MQLVLEMLHGTHALGTVGLGFARFDGGREDEDWTIAGVGGEERRVRVKGVVSDKGGGPRVKGRRGRLHVRTVAR